jgi:hypothetical protein
MKPDLTSDAIEKLRQAAKYAAEHPEYFDMMVYIEGHPILDKLLTAEGLPACGTSAKTGGTIVWQNN